jgi:hypothetical protein
VTGIPTLTRKFAVFATLRFIGNGELLALSRLPLPLLHGFPTNVVELAGATLFLLLFQVRTVCLAGTVEVAV